MVEEKLKMSKSKIDMIKKNVCRGCRQDRYNHQGMCERPGIDAVVTSEKCWHLNPGNIHFDRRWKRYYCDAGDTDKCRESQETVRLGKKMIMHYKGYPVEVKVIRG